MLIDAMGVLEFHPLHMDSLMRGETTPREVLRFISDAFLSDESPAVEQYDEIRGRLARTLNDLLDRPWFR